MRGAFYIHVYEFLGKKKRFKFVVCGSHDGFLW